MKKFLSLLICFTILFSFTSNIYAANELAGAKKYTIGSSKSGSIEEGDESEVYKFSLSTSSNINISLSADMQRIELKLYDAKGKELWHDTPYWNDTTEEISYEKDFVLCKGNYYFSLSKSWGKWEGEYTFAITETSIYETFSEEQNGSNNSTKTADSIVHGKDYIGCIAINDDVDVYEFELSSSGKINVSLSADMQRIELKLYDAKGKELWHDTPYWNDTTEEISYEKDLHLCRGNYYFSVSRSWGKREGKYSFKLLFTSSNESFEEEQNGTNNKINTANIVDINRIYNGMIAMNDDVDIYRVNINNPKLKLNMSADMQRIELKLYDANGKEVWHDTPYWNDTTNEISYSKDLNFASGLYYFSVSKSWGKREGNYSFYFSDGTTTPQAAVVNTIIAVKINGKQVSFDQPPILENGRTLVPLRAIFEALGADVDWDNATQTVIANKGGTKISLQIGSTQMYVNGTVKILDVPAKLINSRTLVPVRAVSEAFGCSVDWDGNTQTVIING